MPGQVKRFKAAAWSGVCSTGDVEGSCRTAVAAVAAAGAEGVELLVLPELYLSGYEAEPAAQQAMARTTVPGALETLAQAAEKARVAVAVGHPHHESGLVYNTVSVIDCNGKVALRYHKAHLWDDGGEGSSEPHERKAFAPGGARPKVAGVAMRSQVVPCGVVICFDLEFPETVRGLAEDGCFLAIVPTALGHPLANFIPPITAHQRALENHLFLIYCNYPPGPVFCGSSRIIAPDGSRIDSSQRDFLVATIDPVPYAQATTRNDYLRLLRRDLYPKL